MMTRIGGIRAAGLMLACGLVLYSSTGLAAEASGLNGADTAWILTSTALVLFMTLPGLALFYGGLVRAQAVLSVLMHCFTICCLASLLWLFGVYSLAFGDGGALNPVIGGLGKAFLAGVGADSLSGTIPETTFFMFQMTFAIITPALIAGAYPERINFPVVILFSSIWLILVYAPAAHWIWGGGWLADLGVMDFAGGMVVHVTAGVSALVLAVLLGSRRGFPRETTPPHSPSMTMTGAAMLWVGWFGFNAGSALVADGSAAMAMTVTHISAAVGALSWAVVEWLRYGKPSLIGTVTGMVAGLASITPASGFVGPVGALVIGLVGGLLCFWATMYIKRVAKIDDSLDVFAVHGVGGALGSILTAVFAATELGGMGLAEGTTMGGQLLVQVLGVGVVAAWSGVATFAVLKIIGFVVALRVSEEEEIEGLDIVAHGERAYELQTLAR
jgi:Amt family ammonium transporter